MKKIFFRMLPVVAAGAVLTACNNAEEVKKKTDEQNAKIQSLVDAKLGELQTKADADCNALIDSLATAKYEAWLATEGKKKGAKPTPKPAPKPKAEEPKKPAEPSITNRPGSNESENKGTITNRPGSNEAEQNKKTNVGTRPGATKTGGNQ
jgi:hypothetical protein